MKQKAILSFLLIATTSLYSCSDHLAPGTKTTEIRNVDEFTEIIVEGSMNVEIEQNENQSVVIEAGENLMPHIETKVVNQRLFIKIDDNSLKWNGSIQVFIAVADLSSIILEGSGDIECSKFEVDDMVVELIGSGDIEMVLVAEQTEINLEGSGDIELAGSTVNQDISLAGSGDIDARFFESENCNVMLAGSGDIMVFASSSFEGEISGSGNIDVWGSPEEFISTVSGSGSISQVR